MNKSSDEREMAELSRRRLGSACVATVLFVVGVGCASLDSRDPALRSRAVEKLTDQSMLARVAVQDADVDVRRIATGKLTDQPVLARIAVEDKDVEVRHEAISKLTDQSALAQIASEAKDADTRKAAVGRLRDQAVLVRIGLQDSDAGVRRMAVGKMTDQVSLAKVAVEDAAGDVRRTAIGMLTNQPVLARIAVETRDSDIRKMAIRQLSGPDSESPVVYEWLAGAYLEQGATDEAVLALLMSTALYVKMPTNNIELCRSVFEQATDMRDRTVTRAGLASLVKSDDARQSIAFQDLVRAIGESSETGLRCRDANLVEEVNHAFREDLSIAAGTQNVKFRRGDLAFVSALGLALQQHPEDWSCIERYLASDPYEPRLHPYLRAVAKADPDLGRRLLEHPASTIRANALIALGKLAAENEKDALVRVAGAFSAKGEAKTKAVETLKKALEDERHLVRMLAMKGLIRHGIDISRQQVEATVGTSDEWTRKYFSDGNTFVMISSLIGTEKLDANQTNSLLSQVGYALFARQTALSDGDFGWLLSRLRDNLSVVTRKPWNSGTGGFTVGSDNKRPLDVETIMNACVVDGYPVEDNRVVSEADINEGLWPLIGKHAPSHAPQLLSALRTASPYVRLFLIQATTGVATNASIRTELWRLAESVEITSEEKAFQNTLVDETTKMFSGGLRTVNTMAVQDAARELVKRIHTQSRCLAIRALAVGTAPEEVARLARLLPDTQVARAIVPALLVKGRELSGKQVAVELLRHQDKDVRLAAAILRLYAADEPEARRVMADALRGDDEALAFAARVAFAADTPALSEVVLAMGDASEETLVSHLVRRVGQQMRQGKSFPVFNPPGVENKAGKTNK